MTNHSHIGMEWVEPAASPDEIEQMLESSTIRRHEPFNSGITLDEAVRLMQSLVENPVDLSGIFPEIRNDG